MDIRYLTGREPGAIAGAAALLLDAFPHSWPTTEIAEAEVMTWLARRIQSWPDGQ